MWTTIENIHIIFIIRVFISLHFFSSSSSLWWSVFNDGIHSIKLCVCARVWVSVFSCCLKMQMKWYEWMNDGKKSTRIVHNRVRLSTGARTRNKTKWTKVVEKRFAFKLSAKIQVFSSLSHGTNTHTHTLRINRHTHTNNHIHQMNERKFCSPRAHSIFGFKDN